MRVQGAKAAVNARGKRVVDACLNFQGWPNPQLENGAWRRSGTGLSNGCAELVGR